MIPFSRITQNPAVMGGKPCVRGPRVTVGMIVGQIAARASIDELLVDYPYIERERMSSKRCAMPHGALRREKSNWHGKRVNCPRRGARTGSS